MLTSEAKYDLVLVVEYFRSSTAYLSIIKGLCSEFSIGIYQVPLNNSDIEKHSEAQMEFLRECQTLGAELINEGGVRTSVLLIPQRPLSKEIISELHSKFDAERTVLLLGFAYPGIKEQDEVLQHFNFSKVYAIDKDFIKFLAGKRGVSSTYNAIDIVEVGLPFKKYPVFNEFSADYILAMPTPFSFANECDKWSFLETVKKLLNCIDVADVIVHKPHNGFDVDQFSSPRFRTLFCKLSYFPGSLLLIKLVARFFPLSFIRDTAAKLYTAYLYEKVLSRTITMEDTGGFPHFAMEAYLPNVRKGVIGGASNTMWGTLFFNLPFYNCVDIFNQNRSGKNKLYGNKKPEKLLELNLQYFMVPYCAGEMQFDTNLWDIPSAGSRDGDLIDELRKEIYSCKKLGD